MFKSQSIHFLTFSILSLWKNIKSFMGTAHITKCSQVKRTTQDLAYREFLAATMPFNHIPCLLSSFVLPCSQALRLCCALLLMNSTRMLPSWSIGHAAMARPARRGPKLYPEAHYEPVCLPA